MADKIDKKYADTMFRQAYNKYYTNVYKFCMAKIPNDKENIDDCVQETFIVLYNKYLEGEEIQFVLSFLYKTAQNFVLKRLRQIEKDRKQPSLNDVINIYGRIEDIDEKLTFEQYSKEISAALNDKDAEIFKLRYEQELDIREIADCMGISIKATYARIERMRDKIKGILGEEFFE